MANLAQDNHTIFDDSLGFFPRLFLATGKMKLPPLQEGIIILTIFPLAIKVLPNRMNIPTKRQIASEVMHGKKRNAVNLDSEDAVNLAMQTTQNCL